MINLGKIQDLEIIKFSHQGAYLFDGENQYDTVLLPKTELPADKSIGDKVTVFVYRDGQDRLISTTRKPYIQLDQLALLRVVNKTKIGAFMDMGLERDVLLPFSEMNGEVGEGKIYLVRMYVDKSDRLAVTMKIRDSLLTNSLYKENDSVMGTIYSIHKEHGLFVAVDEKYDSLIPKEEALGIYEIGEVIGARVSNVNEDGRLVLSLKDRAYLNIDEDAETILDILEDEGGELNLGDKSNPDDIREKTGMSKSAFKRAIGKLYKEKTIKIYPEKIEIV